MGRKLWEFCGCLHEGDVFMCDHYLFSNGTEMRVITVNDFWGGGF